MKKMRKLISSLLLLTGIALVISCADESLDPLNMTSVKKGTILALRGTALNNIYVKGVPMAELFPKIATGAEVFNFDAEFLSEDPASLASLDIYVIKRNGAAREKVLLRNVAFSEFKTTADYPKPWVSVSMKITDILPKLGLPATFPMAASTITTLLTTYSFGIQLEVDLNLVDGTKVLAADLVAAGLYQSNQFYPAQKLTYAMTDYCSYVESFWAGNYNSTENRTTVYGPYQVSLSSSGTANRFNITNFYDCADNTYYLQFQSSTNPATQVVTFPSQTTVNGTLSGTGTYNQCLGTFSIQTTYVSSAASCNGSVVTDVFRYDFAKKP